MEKKMDHHDHCDCGCEHDDYEPIIINTVTDTGEELTFEVLEVFEFEGKDYARLQSCDEDQDEDEAAALVRRHIAKTQMLVRKYYAKERDH